MSSRVWLRRAYDSPTHNDGRRVLIDRLWPRGVSREDAAIDDWCKEVAPSDELRRWFDHDPDRWEEFQQRYESELSDRSEEVDHLVDWSRKGRITLVYAAKDTEHNNALVLRDVIEQQRIDR